MTVTAILFVIIASIGFAALLAGGLTEREW